MRISSPTRALLAGLFVAAGISASLADDIVVTHAQGETTVSKNPETVITFDLATLDTLEALGIEADGVPATNLPEYLSKYAADRYAKVGSLFEPDYEAVAALEPDLIIVAARSSPAYAELSKIAPTIDLTNDWANFEGSIKENSRILGEIFDKTPEVDALIAGLDASIAEAKTAAAGAGTGLVVITSAGEVTNFGPGSRFGWIFDTLGVTPAAAAAAGAEAAPHGDAVSFEYLLEANPDWLFVIDRDAATGSAGAAAAVLDNELVAQTTARQKGQIVEIDPIRSYIVNGGLPAFTLLVDQVGDALAAK